MNRICWYIQGTKYNGLVFIPSKKLAVDCYADTDFVELWGHEIPQDPICARSRNGFVVTFVNYPMLWVSNIQTDIALYTLHLEYVALSHSVRELLPMKIPIKELIDNSWAGTSYLRNVGKLGTTKATEKRRNRDPGEIWTT